VRAVGAIASVEDGPQLRAVKGPLNCRGRVGVLASNGRRPSEDDEVGGSELQALFRDRAILPASFWWRHDPSRRRHVVQPKCAVVPGIGRCCALSIPGERYREMRRVKLPGSSRSVEGSELLVPFRERPLRAPSSRRHCELRTEEASVVSN
jgi:hypothetical protein